MADPQELHNLKVRANERSIINYRLSRTRSFTEKKKKKKKLLEFEMARFCIVTAYTSLKLQNIEAVVAVCCALHIFLMPNWCSVLLRGLSPRANYTDRAAAAGRRSQCQLFADRGVSRGQRNGSPRPLISVFWTGAATFLFK